MTTLNDILSAYDATKIATDTGTRMHDKLRHVVLDGARSSGDTALISRIQRIPQLAAMFTPNSQTEVPVAGTINGRFVSRRIDRMIVDHDTKTVNILDYKTDVSPDTFRDKYTAQVREYVALIRAIYPTYSVSGYLLWTHDFSLEKVC